jgi:hypothetical protein
MTIHPEASRDECLEEIGALEREVERLRELKTPASRELLNITKGCLDNAEAEIERLLAALRDEPEKWSWDVLVMVGRRLLDEVYPADIFTGVSGDTGPQYVVALRNAFRVLGEKT